MEHVGIDIHKVESQICILTESDEVVERRILTQRERFAAVPRSASDLGSAATRAGAALGAGGAGANESALHFADRRPAAARGLAGSERERGELDEAGGKTRAARTVEVGDRAAPGGVCVDRSAARLGRCAPRASRAERRDGGAALHRAQRRPGHCRGLEYVREEDRSRDRRLQPDALL